MAKKKTFNFNNFLKYIYFKKFSDKIKNLSEIY